MMTAMTASTCSGRSTSTRGSNSMPTETKNSTAKASRNGSDCFGRAVAELRLAQHQAGEEGAQRHRHAEQRRRAVGDAHGHRDHAQREQLARAGLARSATAATAARAARPAASAPRRRPPPAACARVPATGPARCCRCCCRRPAPPAPAAAPAPAPSPGLRRSASPPRCGRSASRARRGFPARAAAPRCWPPTARGRTPVRRRPTSPTTCARPAPIAVATPICTTAPGTAILRTPIRSLHREVQADAEHQQHHADLGQLRRQVQVGDEAGRVRPQQHARQQVAHQRRQAQARRGEAQHQRQPQRGSQRDDERHVGVHGAAGCATSGCATSSWATSKKEGVVRCGQE